MFQFWYHSIETSKTLSPSHWLNLMLNLIFTLGVVVMFIVLFPSFTRTIKVVNFANLKSYTCVPPPPPPANTKHLHTIYTMTLYKCYTNDLRLLGLHQLFPLQSQKKCPANTRRSTNVGHPLRRWPNTKSALDQYPVFAGCTDYIKYPKITYQI